MSIKPRLFRDRSEAAELLAEELGRFYRGRDALVLALSPASVPVARIIADRLSAELRLFSPEAAGTLRLGGMTAILVAEGIATGAKEEQAIRTLRPMHPREIVVATPVASRDAYELLEKLADEMLVLHSQLLFFSTSEFYDELPPVAPEEIADALKKTAA